MPGPEFSGNVLNLKLIKGVLDDLSLLQSGQLLCNPEQENAGHNAAIGEKEIVEGASDYGLDQRISASTITLRRPRSSAVVDSIAD